MEDIKGIEFILLFVLVLIFFNCLMSREIYNWTPSAKKHVGLYLLVWFVPVLGFFLANKIGRLGWFAKAKSDGSDSVISGVFMEGGSVLNPGAKYRIEMIESQKSENHQEIKKENPSEEYNNSKSTQQFSQPDAACCAGHFGVSAD